ncbi:unnamed protein product [Discosporangium mesarthrocarpum]
MDVTKEKHDELCTSYAALALYDGEAEITSDQILELIKATGNEVEAYWPVIFASFLQKVGIEDLITTVGAGGGGGSAAGGGGGAGDAGAAEEEKKEEEKEEEEEEVDMGGGMDMFGGGDDY